MGRPSLFNTAFPNRLSVGYEQEVNHATREFALQRSNVHNDVSSIRGYYGVKLAVTQLCRVN